MVLIGCSPDLTFAGISIIVCRDSCPLPARSVYAYFYNSTLSFITSVLTEVMKERVDQVFIELLNNVGLGMMNDQGETLEM